MISIVEKYLRMISIDERDSGMTSIIERYLEMISIGERYSGIISIVERCFGMISIDERYPGISIVGGCTGIILSSILQTLIPADRDY
jgi:hypothetical protein